MNPHHTKLCRANWTNKSYQAFNIQRAITVHLCLFIKLGTNTLLLCGGTHTTILLSPSCPDRIPIGQVLLRDFNMLDNTGAFHWSFELASSVLTTYRWSLSCHTYWHISQVAFRRSGLDRRWHFGVQEVSYPSDRWAVSTCTTWQNIFLFSFGPLWISLPRKVFCPSEIWNCGIKRAVGQCSGTEAWQAISIFLRLT